MMNRSQRGGAVFASMTAVAGGCMCASIADATVTASNAHGFGAASTVKVGALNLLLPPAADATGDAPGPFADSGAAASAGVTALGLGALGTGALDASARSNVNGTDGFRFADATAVANNVGLHIGLGVPLVPNLVDVAAATVSVRAQVSGDFGELAGSGTAHLEGLTVRVLGAAVPITATANAVIFDAMGIRIVANEQTTTGDGIGERAITVNGLHIRFTDALVGTQLINGDVIIAHGTAGMEARSPGCAGGCYADFNGSGGTPDESDVAAFFDAWLVGDSSADTNCSGGTPDGSDIEVFFGQWLAGGC